MPKFWWAFVKPMQGFMSNDNQILNDYSATICSFEIKTSILAKKKKIQKITTRLKMGLKGWDFW